MRKAFKIHREGYKILLTVGISLFIINLLVQALVPQKSIGLILMAVSAIVFLFTAMFFRHPSRLLNNHDKHFISPADGKVVVIEEVFEKEYFNEKRLQVSVFMSPTNVHVNRHPISGTIEYAKYHPGKYLVAWHPKSSELNERNTIVIKNDDTDLLLRQIAGKFARKIVSYATPGEEVTQGSELGFIKFGSRVDLFLPIGTQIDVKLNQKVKGGVTVLASLS